MAKLKICGLRRVEDIDYVNEIKPDYIGFILSDGFKRTIDFEMAQMLKSRLSPDIKAVGVFVNEDKEYIDKFIKNNIIDIVQLHGNEEPEYCKGFDVPVIKYFNPKTFNRINEYDTDYFLFDSGTGTGEKVDWSALKKNKKPFFLAGGINKDNLRRALDEVNPFGIDLSSAVETNGFKDYKKIKEIAEIMKNE